MNRVLILEPAKSVRKSLCDLIEVDGVEVMGVEDLLHCTEALESASVRHLPFDLLIFNVDWLPKLQDVLTTPFIALSDHPSIDEALQMVRSGARDYLCRPYDMNRLLKAVREVIQSLNASDQDDATSRCVERRVRRRRSVAVSEARPMVGDSAEICRMRRLIEKVAPSDARVMILGENGTGKELVARCIHNQSRRSGAPFVEVNCAAIPSELIESELFGHEKGAFTSAIKQRRGKFEQANGGTLFLDEIGDMSLAAQAKVLRALQEHKITRVGSDVDIDVDVRVLAATNKDIRAEIAAGNFREDLYHRLSVIVINVAALRDRAGDIPLLVDHFLEKVCSDYHIDRKTISSDAVSVLSDMRWSGNVRELSNVVERLVVLSDDSIELRDVEMYCCVD